MSKNIIKEIIIILLLILAIILILGVLLYEYIPTNKIIPEKISYTTPEAAKAELSEDVNNIDDDLYIDYHIDSTQLNNYKRIQEYVPGRKNPFESLENKDTQNSETTNSTTSNANTSNLNTQNTDANKAQSGETSKSEQNSTDKTDKTSQEDTGYLPDKGTK